MFFTPGAMSRCRTFAKVCLSTARICPLCRCFCREKLRIIFCRDGGFPPLSLSIDFLYKHNCAASIEGVVDFLLHEPVLARLAYMNDKGYRSAEVVFPAPSACACVSRESQSRTQHFFLAILCLHLITDFRLSFTAAFRSPHDPLPVEFLNPKAFIS